MKELVDMLLSGGAGLVGFSDLRALPAEVRGGLPFGTSFAVPLDPRIVEGILRGPTVAYRDEYQRANRLIDELAGRGAELLRARAIGPRRWRRRSRRCIRNWSPSPCRTRRSRGWPGWGGSASVRC